VGVSVPTLFIKCKNANGAAAQIVASFAKHGIAIGIEQIRVPVFYDGPNEGKEKNFAYVNSLDHERADAALALASMNHDGASFIISEARERIPSRFSGQQLPPALQSRITKQQRESKIVPKGQFTKSFEESDFR
jgi:hypothetical protein